MADALIAIGSNLGDREAILAQAESRMGQLPASRVLARSRNYETVPVGGPPGQGPFLNGAVLLETALEPQSLLVHLQDIEAELGRQRAERWGPRRIDLDLLLYDQVVLDTPMVVLPHPRMAWRRFVLEPASEIAPTMVHATTGWTIRRLLEHLETALPYVAITGPFGAEKTRLAEELARQGGAGLISEPAGRAAIEAFSTDRSGSDRPMELEFLEERTRLLAVDLPRWSEVGRTWLSDFWLDEVMAFARAWLPDDRVEAFRRRWLLARRGVVQPKLLVLLDPPADRLWDRIRRRRRPGESRMQPEVIERVCREIRAEATQPGRGPLLRLTTEDHPEALGEVLAAVQALKHEQRTTRTSEARR